MREIIFGAVAATSDESTIEAVLLVLGGASLTILGVTFGAWVQNRQSRRREVERSIDEASAALPRVIHQLHQACDYLGIAGGASEVFVEKMGVLDDVRLTAQEKCEIVEGRVPAKDPRMLGLIEMLKSADETRNELSGYQGKQPHQLQGLQGIRAAIKVRIVQTESLRDQFLETRRRERTWSRRVRRIFSPS